MTPETFIKKAIEGGWTNADPAAIRLFMDGQVPAVGLALEQILLDPLAWQAVRWVEGWVDIKINNDGWKLKMHAMIDALTEGKTIEQFLKTL